MQHTHTHTHTHTHRRSMVVIPASWCDYLHSVKKTARASCHSLEEPSTVIQSALELRVFDSSVLTLQYCDKQYHSNNTHAHARARCDSAEPGVLATESVHGEVREPPTAARLQQLAHYQGRAWVKVVLLISLLGQG